MFKKQTVQAFSVVAIVLSSLGLILSVIGAIFLQQAVLAFILGIISWSLLLWASILGYKLCTSYKLYDEEYKKVGLRIYAIVVAFILFFFVGLVVGLIISVVILGTLWGLKSNYDEWDTSEPEPPVVEQPTTQQSAPPEDHH